MSTSKRTPGTSNPGVSNMAMIAGEVIAHDGDRTAAIKHLQATSTAAKRDTILKFTDWRGQERTLVYNDHDQEYDELEPPIERTDTVSNIDSFTELVVAEAERRKNKTGEFMNVIFTEAGATFIADTNDRRDVYHYARKPSAQWKALTARLGVKQNHRDFIVWLQSLQPSIAEFSAVLQAFRSLQLNRSAKMISEPMLVDGAKGASYEVKLDVKSGGSASASIPQTIGVKLPFARGDQREYEFDVQIDIDGGEGDAPIITAYAPAVEVIKEKAIVDEMADFDDRTHQLPKLTNLVNF